MSVSLQEAYSGKKSQIRIPSYEGCDLCSATGSADKSGPSTCSTCGGQGKVRSTQGFFLSSDLAQHVVVKDHQLKTHV